MSIADPDSPPPLRKDGDVFILGAGFSKSIDPIMPTLNELGKRILQPFTKTPSYGLLPPAAISAIQDGLIPGGSLEAWLSNLAAPAPFLDRAEQLHNAAIADELKTLIVAEISRSEGDALTRPIPYWLTRLVSLWDRLGATVITFNYDTLVEQGVNASRLPWLFWPNYQGELRGGVAVPLLKMHGSTNWWWISSDKVGTTVQPAPLAGSWEKPQTPEVIRGMDHFVVPPVAVKSDYYDLSVTRDDWLTARDALGSARRLILLGYSAPVTDLTVASLVSNYANPDIPCIVVDKAPNDVVTRLRQFGLRGAKAFEADEPIAKFTEDYEARTSQNIAASLVPLFEGLEAYQDDPVIARVRGTAGAQLPITEISTIGDTTAIIASEWQPGEVLAELAVNTRRLRVEIEDAAQHGRRLILRVPGQPDRAVLNIAQRMIYGRYLAVEA